MIHYQQQWIEILDRQYDLVCGCPQADFWWELNQFLDSLVGSEPFQPYVAHLQREFSDWLQEYRDSLTNEVESATRIRLELANGWPTTDDSTFSPPELVDPMQVDSQHSYFQSLAYFDHIVTRVQSNGVTIWTENAGESDHTEAAILIRVLREKLTQLSDEQRPERLFLQLMGLEESHSYQRNRFFFFFWVWAPAALAKLLEIRERIYPIPREFNSMEDFSNEVFGRFMQPIVQPLPDIESCKMYLRRVYERIRADFGSHLAHYELVQRYKARCMFYDRERITGLIGTASGQLEDALTRDLALYLFDNGVSTFYRFMQGVHEYDLIAPSIAVEAKQYDDAQSRGYLIKGVSQFHSYANGLETDTSNVRELYYVIFRLGGPLYDWPKEIRMNRWTIYPIIIDLGQSRISGRRQEQIRPITREEILNTMSEDKV